MRREADSFVVQERRGHPLVNALRWIVLVPGAVVAAWVAWFLAALFNRWSMFSMGIDPDSLLGRLQVDVFTSGVLGLVFVYTGAKLAPARKHEVVFVLAGIAVLLAGFALFPAVLNRNVWSILALISVAAGAGLVAWSVHTGEIDPDKL